MSINFDRAADYYDATRGYPAEVAARIGAAVGMAAEAGLAARFLEVGVGTGRIALPVAAEGYEYTGVDISVRMMDRLRAKRDEIQQQLGRPLRLSLLEADMQALPFADESFDAVVAAHVFHLVGDADRAALEALRVVRRGGALLICGDAISGSEAESVNEFWRALVRESYGSTPNSSEATAQLLYDLQAADPTLRVDEIRPVQWEFTTSVANELALIRQRLWSNTWVLPDDVFERCLERLTAWCEKIYAGRMDDPLPRSAEFVIRRVRRATV